MIWQKDQRMAEMVVFALLQVTCSDKRVKKKNSQNCYGESFDCKLV